MSAAALRPILAFTLVLTAAAAFAQRAAEYPNRLVRVIVPFAPGGATDTTARLFANFAERRWKQPVIVDNRPGAGTLIAADAVAKAPADGYTLLMGSANLGYEHLLNKDWPLRPENFTPMALIAGGGMAMTVASNVPARSFAEFIAWAKANPGKVNQGIALTVSPDTEYVFAVNGVDMVKVPYKGGPAVVNALVAGEVHVFGSFPQDVIPLHRSGRVRILAYSESRRHPAMPEIPTIAESGVGLEGFNAGFWFGLLGPAGTPPEVVARVNAEAVDLVRSPEAAERFASLNLNTYTATPEETRRALASATQRVEELLKRGVKLR
jgi:tripartite-type tricarboxylate transporter receptor subunit TctC